MNLDRFKEPSTWSGIGLLASIFAPHVSPVLIQAFAEAGLNVSQAVGGNTAQVFNGLAAIGGLMAVWRREGGPGG